MRSLRLCVAWLCLAFSAAASGQSLGPALLGSAGAQAENTSAGSLSWSVGEPVTASYSQNASMLTQGFHQVFATVSTAAESPAELLTEVLAFPNPSSDRLYISSETPVHIRLLHLHGIEVFAVSKPDLHHTVETATLPAGLYLLEARDPETRRFKTFKIVITH